MHLLDILKKIKPGFYLVFIILLVGFSRYLPIDHPSLFNFSPVLAIFLFCGAYIKGSFSWLAPVIAIFLSDLFLNPSYGKNFLEPYMLTTISCYVLVWILGYKIGNRSKLTNWLGGAILSAVLFHLITCTFSWILNPAYAKTTSGLLQSIIIGEPGFAPSYLFLRNSILSTIFFSVCFRWFHLWLTQFSLSQTAIVAPKPQV
ncbi:MAG TPA: hypothetical protein DCL00_02945 [Opitutae bacterium]|nr:hypothetical protein [Opitutae bacterium]HAF58523.1 hypothetical protein [Opitutae bacterium]|tara:strand:- start:3172 stop:3777 length:606 start_codon:yes stop_codon:yes gene_type:complete